MGSPTLSKLMSIKIDGSVVGASTDFSLTTSKDMLEALTLDSGGWGQQIPDMKKWSVSGSGLVLRSPDAGKTGIFEIATKLLNTDASVMVAIVPDVSIMKYFSGVGYFSSLNMEVGVGSPVSFSYEIAGDGPLSILTTP
jgi:hypothetical protein